MAAVQRLPNRVKFRLVNGVHIDSEPGAGPDKQGVVPDHVYYANQPGNNVIESDLDLIRMHPNKFVLDGAGPSGQIDAGALSDDQLSSLLQEAVKRGIVNGGVLGTAPAIQQPVASQANGLVQENTATETDSEYRAKLEKMSASQLTKLAEADEVDVTGTKNKGELIELLLAGRH